MRSIIDEIAEAEALAEQIRQEAAASSRELIAKTRADSEQALSDLDAAEREKTRAALSNADEEGKKLAADIQKELSDAADAQCASARGRMEQAVVYLMQKVREIA